MGFIHDPARVLGQTTEWFPTGSREIVPGHSTARSDYDFVVLAPDRDHHGYLRYLQNSEDFTLDGQNAYERRANRDRPRFWSLRKNEGRTTINLIVVDSRDFFRRWKQATIAAKRLRLINRDDRVSLFKVFLYGRRAYSTARRHRV